MRWRDVDVHTVVRAYLNRRMRKESPPAIDGLIGEVFTGKGDDDGLYETLVSLMRGVGTSAVLALTLMEFGHAGSVWERVPIMPREQWEQEHPGVAVPEWDQQRAVSPTLHQVARRMGTSLASVQSLVAHAYETVADRLWKLKGR